MNKRELKKLLNKMIASQHYYYACNAVRFAAGSVSQAAQKGQRDARSATGRACVVDFITIVHGAKRWQRQQHELFLLLIH